VISRKARDVLIGGASRGFYDASVEPRTASGELSTLGKLGLSAGAFVCAVSFSLFIHTISQLSSPLVCAAFIAAGIVARRRVATESGKALAIGVLVGGGVAAVASIVLAAAGH
jgi:hypothetical protein